jgi:PhnB protein
MSMSKRSPCPPDYPWLIPYLVVKDGEAAIAFYEKAFGFAKRMAMPGKDGKAMHVEMTWRGSMIMFGSEAAAEAGGWTHRSPATSGVASPVSAYVYCDDVDALFARAVAAGAKAIRPPQTMFYGDRVCTLEDPDHYWWSFATNVADFDPSKAP